MTVLPKETRQEETTDDGLTAVVSQLFAQHHVAVFNYVRQLTGDADMANDLTQETFLRLLNTRHKLPNVQNKRAWVYRIATNLTYNALRKQKLQRWLPWRDHQTDLWQAGPGQQNEAQTTVQAALHKIEPKYRMPLLLYASYDFSVREIAETLAISESNVKVRLHRARKMFQLAYAEATKNS